MNVAIMQPYFFPYLGYFQLMHAVDLFVFYDDVQYMKGGWVNRNRILQNGEAAWLTMPVAHTPLSTPINQSNYINRDYTIPRIKRRLRECYARAPQFSDAHEIIFNILDNENSNVAEFNINLLTLLGERLGMTCRFMRSSDLKTPNRLSGQERVIGICSELGASRYSNAIGGLNLYSDDDFAENGIDLTFIKSTPNCYQQLGKVPIQNLSIIDVMMFNKPSTIQSMSQRYESINNN